MSNDKKAWGEFWAKNAGSGGGGCLPQRWASIEAAQKKKWQNFAATLPQGARVLDLATGDGRVMRWMRDTRDDLVLKGIDLAPQLPPPPSGTESLGGIAMEDTPFEANSFDAVVSQFGFEYGDTAKAAAEIGRVLSDGGRVALMVHRGDGPILEHNRARMAAIDWILKEKNGPGAVTKALTTPGAGPAVAAQVAAALAALGAKQFGESSPAWEIPEAMRRACVMGQQSGSQGILGTFEAIKAQADNEVGRIESLARACATADDRDGLLKDMSDHGLSLTDTDAVNEPSGRALADFITFN